MGAPFKNRNAIRHGLRAGMLPRGASYVKRECDLLRREIEAAVVERRGEISLYDAALIQTSIRWERHGMLVQRWLRKHSDDMTPDQKITYSRDIARASESRDRCLKALGLDKKRATSMIDVLYSDAPDGPKENP